MRVMRPDDVLVTKLMAMTEHALGYESCLEIARSLREQIDWDALRERTKHSAYARAFFTMAEGLGLMDAEAAAANRPRPRARRPGSRPPAGAAPGR
jgi:hypothetical protein